MVKFFNPVSGAFSIGIGSAISASIGSAIQGHNVHNQTVTVLAGGAFTGALAGVIGILLPKRKEDDANYNSTLNFCTNVLAISLHIGAYLLAQPAGEEFLKYGTQWGQVTVDELIGIAVVAAAAVGVGLSAAVIGCVCCCIISGDPKSIITNIRENFFAKFQNDSNSDAPAASPV